MARGALRRPPGVEEVVAASPGFGYVDFYRAEPTDRILLVKAGVSPWMAKRLVADLQFDQRVLFPALNLSVATVNRKAARDEALASDEGERVIGVAKLIGQAQVMFN